MQRGVRGHRINIRDLFRNKWISRIRSPGERPYAVIENVFHIAHVHVTTFIRARLKMMFAAFSFNLYQLGTLKNRVSFSVCVPKSVRNRNYYQKRGRNNCRVPQLMSVLLTEFLSAFYIFSVFVEIDFVHVK
jgi:hypothetical protein